MESFFINIKILIVVVSVRKMTKLFTMLCLSYEL